MSSFMSLARIAFVSVLGFGLLAPGSLITLGCAGSRCAVAGTSMWAQSCLGSAAVHAAVAASLVAYLGAARGTNNYAAALITGVNMLALTPGVLLRLPGSLLRLSDNIPNLYSIMSFSKVSKVDVLVHAVVFAFLQMVALTILKRSSRRSMRLDVMPGPWETDPSSATVRFLSLVKPSRNTPSVVTQEWVTVDAPDQATIFTVERVHEDELSHRAYIVSDDFYLQSWLGQMQGYKASTVPNGFDMGGLIHDITGDDEVYTESWGALFLDSISLPSDHPGGKLYFDPKKGKLVLHPTLALSGVNTDVSGLYPVRAVMV